MDSGSEYTAEELCTQAASWDSCTHARRRRNLFLIRAAARSHRSRNSMPARVEKNHLLSALCSNDTNKSLPRETWTSFSCSPRGKLDRERERRRQPVIPAELESTVGREMKTGFPVHPGDGESKVYRSPKSKKQRIAPTNLYLLRRVQTHHFQREPPPPAPQTRTAGPSSRSHGPPPNSAPTQTQDPNLF